MPALGFDVSRFPRPCAVHDPPRPVVTTEFRALSRKRRYGGTNRACACAVGPRPIRDVADVTLDQQNLSGPPPEDAGSETLSRYDYQISLTALECTKALGDNDIFEIICEWWEDFVVVRSGGRELVSVKHLEPSKGAWSLAALVEDGGLRHLFERWRATGREATCRLLTNAGLKPGPKEATAVQRATLGEGLHEVAALLERRLGANSVDEMRRFLAQLTIENELPKRDDLLSKLLVEVLPPLCEGLAWPPDEIADRFEAIRHVVARAASSDVRSEQRALKPRVEAVARAQAKKTITRDKLHAALERLPARRTSRLVEKLDAARFGPTDIERCKRLRADWLELEYRWTPGLPGGSEADQVRRRVQDLAVEAETRARSEELPYGHVMRDELVALLGAHSIPFEDADLSLELLLGVAYDETDRCRIWWSSRIAPGVSPS